MATWVWSEAVTVNHSQGSPSARSNVQYLGFAVRRLVLGAVLGCMPKPNTFPPASSALATSCESALSYSSAT
eukprot:5286010-Ditylum_brightwellii.AAC.1